jgi:hypothetical protein
MIAKARLDGLYLVSLGALVFVLIGFALENAAPVSTVDFRVVYYSARCLLEHRDPYSEKDLEYTYRVDGGETPKDTAIIRLTETQYIYFPTASFITLPFALLPFKVAHFLWLALIAASLILGSVLTWEAAAGYAPVLSGALVCITLATSELFLVVGNPGGIAIGLCAIAVWSLIREKWVFMGVLCMAASLMLKPHVPGLVWLYFLLAGGEYRKRAWQVLGWVAGLSLPFVIWISVSAPNWLRELATNMAGNAEHGGLSDPGPHSIAGHGIGMMINLQTVFSMFRDDPKFYNPLAYLAFAIPFLIWVAKTIRTRASSLDAWFGVAPISALAMLPVYHRLFDAKLFMVAIPACAMLWARRGVIAWLSLILCTAAILGTGGSPWAIFFSVMKHINLPDTPLNRAVYVGLQVFTVPLTLYIAACFFLWIYVRNCPIGARWLSSANHAADSEAGEDA